LGINGGPHEGKPSGVKLGRVAAAMRLGRHVTREAIACEEVTDTAETKPKAGRQLAHRTLVVLIGLHNPDPHICGVGAQKDLL
jgi:hypothetical protein